MFRILIPLMTVLISHVAYATTDIDQVSYPKVKLTNDIIDVSIFLPDAENGYYRGTRFDWSGIIENVTYNGHTFYAPLHETHNPTAHDSVSGPAEEFGMYHPMGFEDAKQGETFVKVGVGILEKNADKDYQFYGNYKLVEAGDWQIKTTGSTAEFSQQLSTENGWGYHYTKRIELAENKAEYSISHQLKNTGKKRIELDNYSHNFTIIDNTPYGPDYTVSFPFSAENPTLVNDLAWYKGHNISVNEPLNKNALWHIVNPDPSNADMNAAIVTNNITGAGISFKGDSPTTHFIFWAVERAACPEPFISIDLAPNEQKVWQTTYRFTAHN